MATKKKVVKTKIKKGVGVIAAIVEAISRDKGASVEEIVTTLTKKFPDRDPAGMKKTALIQANKNCTSKDREENRGLVYFRRGR